MAQINVIGFGDPNANGIYSQVNTHDGHPYYEKLTGDYIIIYRIKNDGFSCEEAYWIEKRTSILGAIRKYTPKYVTFGTSLNGTWYEVVDNTSGEEGIGMIDTELSSSSESSSSSSSTSSSSSSSEDYSESSSSSINNNLWTPDEITTDLWLDANDASTISATGSLVDQWDDKSGNNRHALPVAPASRPLTGTKTLNGLNLIDADGGGKWMISTFSPAITLTTQAHIFQVREVAGTPNREIIFDITKVGPNPAIGRLVDNTQNIFRNSIGGVYGINDGVFPDPGNRILYDRYINASDLLERYHDGAATPQESVTFTNDSFTTETFDFSYLFCDATGGDDMLGGLGEFIIIFGSLGAGDRDRIVGYLAWKFLRCEE
jgi:hypothetical protein